MITRGSKFYFTAAIVGLLSALVYSFITAASDQGGVLSVFSDGGVVGSIVGPMTLGWKGAVGEHVGYVTLMTFGAVMALLGAITTATRDADAESLAQLAGIEVSDLPEPAVPVGLSWWPMLCALGTGIAVVGATYSTLMMWGGVVVVGAGVLEWTAKSWSERAAGDVATNSENRNRLFQPVEVPIAAVLVIGVVAVAVSRVLLAVPKESAVYLIIALAAVVFVIANLLARRPDLTGRVLGTVVVVSLLVIIVAGIAGGVAGTRDIEEHHGDSAEEGAAPAGLPNGTDPFGLAPDAGA